MKENRNPLDQQLKSLLQSSTDSPDPARMEKMRRQLLAQADVQERNRKSAFSLPFRLAAAMTVLFLAFGGWWMAGEDAVQVEDPSSVMKIATVVQSEDDMDDMILILAAFTSDNSLESPLGAYDTYGWGNDSMTAELWQDDSEDTFLE